MGGYFLRVGGEPSVLSLLLLAALGVFIHYCLNVVVLGFSAVRAGDCGYVFVMKRMAILTAAGQAIDKVVALLSLPLGSVTYALSGIEEGPVARGIFLFGCNLLVSIILLSLLNAWYLMRFLGIGSLQARYMGVVGAVLCNPLWYLYLSLLFD